MTLRPFATILLAALVLSGCAVAPLAINTQPRERYDVPASRVVVDNLSIQEKIGVNDVVYVNGWAPAHSGFQPPLNEAFFSRVKAAINPTGESGRIDISVLRVGFFIEKNVADDVAFVGLFTMGRERGFKCDADVNVKTEKDSRRISLSHQIRRSYFDNNEQLTQFIDTCHTELVKQLVAEIKKDA